MAGRSSRLLVLALAAALPSLAGARAWGQDAPPPEAAPAAPPPDAPAPGAPPPAAPPLPGPAAPGAPVPTPFPSGPDDAAVAEASPPEPVRRPRLSAAVGMGASFDAVGFSDGDVRPIPSFFTVLGIGDGPYGFDIGAFASEAAGRHGTQSPVDRLALDAFGVIRPGAWYRPDDPSYGLRVLRGLGAELGLGFERDGQSAVSGTRFLIHTGLRVDLPLSPVTEPTELRLRLAARRGIGLYTPKLYGSAGAGALDVDDSTAEIYGALVVVF